MPIKVTCPKCQGVLHAPDDAGGKRGKCPTCGTVLAIPAPNGTAAAPSPLPPPPVTAPTSVPAGGGKPLGDVPGYGLLPPTGANAGGGGEVRQSSVPMLPPPGKPAPAAAKPAAGFGSPPPVKPAARPKPVADAGEEVGAAVRGFRKARRGLGLVQTGQFFLLLAGLAGPGVSIAQLYGAIKTDREVGFLNKPGLSAVTEIKYGAVLVPLALGVLLLVAGRIGFGNLPRRSYARGPAKWAGMWTLFAAAGLATALAMSANQVFNGSGPVGWTADGLPELRLLHDDELPGRLQLGGLVLFVVALILAEGFFTNAVGRLAAGVGHPGAAARHTRFVLLTHLLLASGVGLLVFRHLSPELYRQGWDGTVGFFDGLLAKAGEARPAVALGLMAVPSVVVWFLYARLVGGGRRAAGDWLAAHDPAG